MRCWRAENFNCSGIYRGHRYAIWCVDESPVGMYMATGSKDLTARLWSLENEFPLITYVGHTQDVEVNVKEISLIYRIYNYFCHFSVWLFIQMVIILPLARQILRFGYGV